MDDDTLERLLREIDEIRQLKMRRREHTYVEDLIRLLLPCSDGMRRSNILNRLEVQRRNDGLPIPRRFEQAVQSAFNQNCVDSAVFKKKNLPESKAPFFCPEGSGSGIWAVDPERVEKWLRKRRCVDDV